MAFYNFEEGKKRVEEILKNNDETDRADAFLDDDETFEGYSWIFNRVIPIVPFPVKGKLHLFEVERELDDLEAIDIDYDTKQYDVDVATWWKSACGCAERCNLDRSTGRSFDA